MGAQAAFGLHAANADFIVQQINQIFDQMLAAAAPYTGSTAPWPPAVQTQLNDLWAAANGVAGGDAAAYLHNYALQLEIQDVANDEFDEPDGNAPDYTVLYMAEILRPGGELILRSQTEPWGQ